MASGTPIVRDQDVNINIGGNHVDCQSDSSGKESVYVVQDHPTLVLDTLHSYTVTGEFCDISFQIGDNFLYAHKCVIAAASQYFHGILDKSDRHNMQITTPTNNVQAFQSILGSMFTGQLTISMLNVKELLHINEIFCLEYVNPCCTLYLKENLTDKNCLKSLAIASMYALKDVIISARNHISSIDHFSHLELETVSIDDLIKAMTELNPRKEVMLEYKKLDIMSRWAMLDKDNMETHLNALLALVDHNLFSDKIKLNRFLENRHDVLSCQPIIQHLMQPIESDPPQLNENDRSMEIEYPSDKHSSDLYAENVLDSVIGSIVEISSHSVTRENLSPAHSSTKHHGHGHAPVITKLTKDSIHEDAQLEDNSRVKVVNMAKEKSYIKIYARKQTEECGELPAQNTERLSSILDEKDDIPIRTKRYRGKRATKEEDMHCCTKCPKKFSTPSGLAQHEKGHGRSQPYLCDTCGFATHHAASLSVHKKLHTGQLLSCPMENCNYQATRKSRLDDHIRTHDNVKDFVCPECGKGFTSQRYLQRHRNIHLKVNPFQCEQCGYSSSRKDKLKEHIKKNHQKYSSVDHVQSMKEHILSRKEHIKKNRPKYSRVDLVQSTMIKSDKDLRYLSLPMTKD